MPIYTYIKIYTCIYIYIYKDSHILSHTLDVVVRKYSKTHEACRNWRRYQYQQQQQKKSNWLYKYAHGVCSYFEGQVSKLSCKFCFTCYSLQITLSCSPVNTSFSFKNKAFKFLTCREKLQTWKIQKEYKEEKKKCCFLNSLSTAILI